MKLKLNRDIKTFSFWIEPLICFLIFALSIPMVYAFSRAGFDPHHTGLMYKGALDVANGKVLFLETFTQYGALTTWIQAFFILIFGRRVTSILLATAVFYAIGYVLIYLLARRFFGRVLSVTATVITVFLGPYYFWEFHPWASVFALVFLLAALHAMLHAVEREGKWAWILSAISGFCVALTFWCRQPVGIVGFLAGILCVGIPAAAFWKEREIRQRFLRLMLFFAAGFAAGIVLLLLPILLTGAFGDFVTQSIKGMFDFASDRSQAEEGGFLKAFGILLYNLFLEPSVKTDDLPILNILWNLLPLMAVGITVYAVVKLILAAKRRTPEVIPAVLPLLIYGIFAASAWHQYYPVGCYRHWYWGAFLCVPAALLVLKNFVYQIFRIPELDALKQKHRYRYAAFAFMILFVFGGNVFARIDRGIDKLSGMNDLVYMENEHYEDLNGLYMYGDVAPYYNGLFDAMHELQAQFPDVDVVNATGNGVFAIFGDNFHPMFVNWGDFPYEDYPEALDAYIESDRPIYIGAAAPAEDYVLWYAPTGFSNDWWEWSHRMPANIWLPIELYEQLQ